jgi:hypothetical protein
MAMSHWAGYLHVFALRVVVERDCASTLGEFGFHAEASEQHPCPQSWSDHESKAGLLTIIYNVKCVLNWHYVVC